VKPLPLAATLNGQSDLDPDLGLELHSFFFLIAVISFNARTI